MIEAGSDIALSRLLLRSCHRLISRLYLFGGSCRVADHADSYTYLKTRHRFSAFLLGMIQRSRSHDLTSDTNKKSSFLTTKSSTGTHQLDVF